MTWSCVSECADEQSSKPGLFITSLLYLKPVKGSTRAEEAVTAGNKRVLDGYNARDSSGLGVYYRRVPNER